MKKVLLLLITGSILAVGCSKNEGCIDLEAVNYDVKAEEDDGSCVYPDTIIVNDTTTINDTTIIFKSDTVEICKKDTLVKKESTFYGVNTRFSSRPYIDWMGYSIDGAKYCRNSVLPWRMFFVAVIDKNNLSPWEYNEYGDFGHLNYRSNVIDSFNRYNFYFSMDYKEQIEAFLSFLDTIPDNNYIFIYTFRGNNFERVLNLSNDNDLGNRYREIFEKIGANVDSLKDYNNNYPYMLFYEKGNTSSAKEKLYYERYDSVSNGVIELKATMKNY